MFRCSDSRRISAECAPTINSILITLGPSLQQKIVHEPDPGTKMRYIIWRASAINSSFFIPHSAEYQCPTHRPHTLSSKGSLSFYYFLLLLFPWTPLQHSSFCSGFLPLSVYSDPPTTIADLTGSFTLKLHRQYRKHVSFYLRP
jgi:hypothetical protein